VKHNIFLIKYFRQFLYLALLSVTSVSFAAIDSATVTPVGIGAWTNSSTFTSWNSGYTMAVRLSALYPWASCSYNMVWFDGGSVQGQNILSMLRMAIKAGKPVAITVKDDTLVDGVICEMTSIETLP